MGVCKK